MSNINKAILKVAQANPEFRKALTAELKQPPAHRKQGDVENKMRQGFYGAYSLLQKMETATQGFDLTRERYDGSANKLENLKTLAMKVKDSLDSGIGALEKFDVWIKDLKALSDKRRKYLSAVTREMARNTPDSVSNATDYFDGYWSPLLKWSGSNGAKSILVTFDPTTDQGAQFLDTKLIWISSNTGFAGDFRIKNPNNAKAAAQAIWAELEKRGET